MSNSDMPSRFFSSKPPTFDNGSIFLGYKVPSAQTFTSFSPSSDINAYLQALTGLGGWQQRQLLQSPSGTQILNQAANGKTNEQVSYLGMPSFHSKASCQTDSDCPSGQTCYTFNEQVFGPKQGPTCSPTVYPEIMIGNQVNNGKPLRQYSNYCYTDEDCRGVDKYTGKPKVGMSCNHYYKGPSMYEKNGLCQVQYESEGRRYFLQTPPGWVMPLNEDLKECNVQSDCGPSGINGWVRCVGGSADGKKYCVWPGKTSTPSPRDLEGKVPEGMKKEPRPSVSMPNRMQSQLLDIQADQAAQVGLHSSGGSLRNVQGPPTSPSLLISGGVPKGSVPEPANVNGFK